MCASMSAATWCGCDHKKMLKKELRLSKIAKVQKQLADFNLMFCDPCVTEENPKKDDPGSGKQIQCGQKVWVKTSWEKIVGDFLILNKKNGKSIF